MSKLPPRLSEKQMLTLHVLHRSDGYMGKEEFNDEMKPLYGDLDQLRHRQRLSSMLSRLYDRGLVQQESKHGFRYGGNRGRTTTQPKYLVLTDDGEEAAKEIRRRDQDGRYDLDLDQIREKEEYGGIVREIPFGELVMDKENIRVSPSVTAGFNESVESRGILEPLLVRELDSGKYGIVCGYRRFLAVLYAGLKTVPAVVRDLDDLDAQALSVIDNRHRGEEDRHREEVPEWRIMEVVAERFGRINGDMDNPEKVEKIAEDLNLSRDAVARYLDIAELPFLIRARLKEPGERTGRERKALDFHLPGGPPDEQVPIEVASRAARTPSFLNTAREGPGDALAAIKFLMVEYRGVESHNAGLKAVDECLESFDGIPEIDPSEFVEEAPQ